MHFYLFLKGCQLPTPCITRWNSKYDCTNFVMKLDPKKLKLVMKSLKLKPLDETDRIILNDYILVMRHIAHYLDVLQKEKNSFLGCVIPCIQKMYTEMEQVDFPANSFGYGIRSGIQSHLTNRYIQK